MLIMFCCRTVHIFCVSGDLGVVCIVGLSFVFLVLVNFFIVLHALCCFLFSPHITIFFFFWFIINYLFLLVEIDVSSRLVKFVLCLNVSLFLATCFSFFKPFTYVSCKAQMSFISKFW